MRPEITIAQAQPEDAPGIAQVQHDTWLATHPNEEFGITKAMILARVQRFLASERIDRWREFITDPRQHVVVARHNDAVIGFISAKKSTPANQLTALYVLPAHHGEGAAPELMARIFAWLGEDQPIELEVATYNLRAINFYRRHGFVSTGQTENSEGIPTMVMSRPAHSSSNHE